jgi:putative SbcD/Mre11-related phosphoesterase
VRRPILQQFEDWQLTPEGAVIHAGERTAVIADLHLGYEWARGAAGDCVPAHSLEEALGRLRTMLDRHPVEKLVVAGDFVESARPCLRTAEDVRRLEEWLNDRGVSLLLVEGNHDRLRQTGLPPALMTRLPSSPTFRVAAWTISHGDRPIEGERTITGHYHPVIRLHGVTAPCFLVGPGRIMLPSFSTNAAGCDLLAAALPAEWPSTHFRCIASTGSELLDFGPLSTLRTRCRIAR